MSVPSRRLLHHALALSFALAFAGHNRAAAARSWCADRCDQVVIDWNATAHQVIQAADGYINPLAASRALAMMHLAMHDAANAVRPRYAPYAGALAQKNADPAVAAVAAAHDVLAALYPQQQDKLLRAALAASLLDAGIGEPVSAGTAVGKAAAQRVLARREGDGSGATVPYQTGSRPGEYRYTPGFDFVFAPHWRRVLPFALKSASQFRVAPPPALGSAEYARDLDEVARVGSDRPDAQRSADQTHYAAFWYEFSDIGWNRVARAVSRSQPQDLWQRARSFALLNVAMADAYVAGWVSKFHHNFWRPVTAIRAAGDAGFNPMLPTPPVQDHPSAHSALGAAAATVLAHTFGSDAIAFSFASSSAQAANPLRSFKSFSEAARENADSRVRAGLHFRFATSAGVSLGRQVGEHVVANTLRPIDSDQVEALLCTKQC